MHRSTLLFPLLLAATVGCGTDPDSLNKDFARDNKYAQTRVLSLLPQAQDYSVYVMTGEELPISFAFSSPGTLMTAYKQQVIGEWTGYASKATATVATGKLSILEAERAIAVLANSSVAGSELQPILQWNYENPTSGTQAKVRFVAGFGGLANAAVKVGTTSLTGPFDPGLLSSWTEVAPGTTTVEVTPSGGSTVTFPGVTLAAGEVWTFGLIATSATDWKLVTFKEGEAQTQLQNPAP